MITYEEILAESIENYDIIQEQFIDSLKINDYSNWFYDQSTELLTFSKENDELNLKYVPIGTYSFKSNTFMWAWDNKSSIENTKVETLKVKQFGEKYLIDKLITGVFETDKCDAGDLSAIALKILGGIGLYTTENEEDKIKKYFLIKEVVDNKIALEIKEKAKKDSEKLIECSNHGLKRHAFVCQHLNLETKTGFEESFDTYKGMNLAEDDDLCAWCNLCEKERLKTDGWNDESEAFAKLKLICDDCYFELKDFNLAENKNFFFKMKKFFKK